MDYIVPVIYLALLSVVAYKVFKAYRRNRYVPVEVFHAMDETSRYKAGWTRFNRHFWFHPRWGVRTNEAAKDS